LLTSRSMGRPIRSSAPAGCSSGRPHPTAASPRHRTATPTGSAGSSSVARCQKARSSIAAAAFYACWNPEHLEPRNATAFAQDALQTRPSAVRRQSAYRPERNALPGMRRRSKRSVSARVLVRAERTVGDPLLRSPSAIPHSIHYVNRISSPLGALAGYVSRLTEVAIAQRRCQPICHCSAKLPSRGRALGR
jgi:hypothetical protein